MESFIPDTLRVISISSGSGAFDKILPLVAVLIGAITGGLITYMTGRTLAKQNTRSQLAMALFSKRLDVFTRLSEIAWEGHNFELKKAPGETREGYPIAYRSFEALREWNNTLSNGMDRNAFFVTKAVGDAFQPLSDILVKHLDELTSNGSPGPDLDLKCRNVGRRSLKEVQELTLSFIQSLRSELDNSVK